MHSDGTPHKTLTFGLFEAPRRLMGQSFRIRPGRAEEATEEQKARMVETIRKWVMRRADRAGNITFSAFGVSPIGQPTADAVLAVWIEMEVPVDLLCVSGMFWDALSGGPQPEVEMLRMVLPDGIFGQSVDPTDKAGMEVGGETVTVGTTKRQTH